MVRWATKGRLIIRANLIASMMLQAWPMPMYLFARVRFPGFVALPLDASGTRDKIELATGIRSPRVREPFAPALTKPQTEQALGFVAEVERDALVVDAAQLGKSRLPRESCLICSLTIVQSLRDEGL